MSSFGASSVAEVVLFEAGSSAPVEGLVTRFRLLMAAQRNRPGRPQTSLRNASRSADHLEHRVDRAVAAADLQRAFDRAGDELFGQQDRGEGIAALGQVGGDRGGKDAAAAVSVRGCDARGLKLDELGAVEEVVDRLLLIGVASLDDGDPGPKRYEIACGLAAFVESPDRSTEKHLGLGDV